MYNDRSGAGEGVGWGPDRGGGEAVKTTFVKWGERRNGIKSAVLRNNLYREKRSLGNRRDLPFYPEQSVWERGTIITPAPHPPYPHENHMTAE